MSVAACAILGHFSKTLWLLLLPQLLNFLFMLPQYLKYPGSIPCPRHRMPSFDPASGNINASVVEFTLDELSTLGRAAFHVYCMLGLVAVEHLPSGKVRMTNLTLVCLCLHVLGSCREDVLCARLLAFQVCCSLFAFFVRLYLARLFYTDVL